MAFLVPAMVASEIVLDSNGPERLREAALAVSSLPIVFFSRRVGGHRYRRAGEAPGLHAA